MNEFEIDVYEAEHQPYWLLDFYKETEDNTCLLQTKKQNG